MARRPLSSMQYMESPQLNKWKITTDRVSRKSDSRGTPAKVESIVVTEKGFGTDHEFCSLPSLYASVQGCRQIFPSTPQNSPSNSRARKSGIAGTGNKTNLKLKNKEKTEGGESIAYWKELAESRRQALDAALQENYDLHKRVEKLETENANLEEIVKEGRQLAEMINSIVEDDELALEESGIERL